MFRGLRNVWLLLVGIALLGLANGLQGSLVGIRAAAEQFSATSTGIIMSGYSAGLLASAFLTPRVVVRVGHIRVFVAFASIVSTAVLLIPFWINGAWWFFSHAFRAGEGRPFAAQHLYSSTYIYDCLLDDKPHGSSGLTAYGDCRPPSC